MRAPRRPSLHVATLNIRNIADRWEERLPLLLADMAALQPDVIGLQEVVFAAQQDRIIGAAGAARYTALRAAAGRPEYGNAVLVRESLGADAIRRLDLGYERSAGAVRFEVDGVGPVTFVVAHLHHVPADEAIRDEQVGRLVEWLAGDDAAAVIVVGDFNAEPVEPAYRRMVEAGYRSAFAEANGEEPAVTWPSGIQAPGMDTDGEPGCLDYIWLRGAVRADSARLCFDRPAVHDATLYPSDHLGLSAILVPAET